MSRLKGLRDWPTKISKRKIPLIPQSCGRLRLGFWSAGRKNFCFGWFLLIYPVYALIHLVVRQNLCYYSVREGRNEKPFGRPVLLLLLHQPRQIWIWMWCQVVIWMLISFCLLFVICDNNAGPLVTFSMKLVEYFKFYHFRNYVASDWNIFSLFIDVFDWGSTQPVIGWAPWAFDSFAAWCERNRRLSCSRSPLLLTDLPQLRKSSASLFPPADADSCDLFRKEGGILKKIIDHVMTTFLTLLNLTFKFNYWLF